MEIVEKILGKIRGKLHNKEEEAPSVIKKPEWLQRERKRLTSLQIETNINDLNIYGPLSQGEAPENTNQSTFVERALKKQIRLVIEPKPKTKP